MPSRSVTWIGRILGWSEVLLIASFLCFRLYLVFNTPVDPDIPTPPPAATPTATQAPPPPPPPQPDRINVTIPLKRGNFTFYRYSPGAPEFATHPKAVIIFGSGDGGFSSWEDRVSKSLQFDGYEILGIDYPRYSKTDYDLPTLQADLEKIAQSSLSTYGANPPPLIVGGWSMGAEQAVAAAGGPHPLTGLKGLLLISPGDRGRYGLRAIDRWNVSPTGAGTFALQDFAQKLHAYRVVQWDGKLDLLGSKSWLDTLTASYKSYDFPYGMHDYDGASDSFLALLKQSIDWLLASPDSLTGSRVSSKEP